ncbi:MAG: hypothetical protein ABIP30_11990 [Ferruginibacter sp.]
MGEIFHGWPVYPIPWFDDICTDIRIDIFTWTVPGKTYPLVIYYN